MSTLRPKRAWTKRPRSSQFPEVISPLPPDASTGSSTEAKDSVKAKDAAKTDEALLKATNAVVFKAEELISQNVSLSDSRFQAMRHKVESAMPRLYELTQDCASSHSSSHTSSRTYILMRTAEAFLKKFPDTMQTGVLRPHNSPPRENPGAPTGAGVSPKLNTQSPSTFSPPRVSLAQAAIPAVQRLQPQPQTQAPATASRFSQPVPSTPVSTAPLSAGHPGSLQPPNSLLRNHSPGIQSFPMQHPIPNTTHPSPSTPSPSALVQPGSYPDTRRQNLPGMSRPPLWSRHYDACYTPSHFYDAVEHTTQHQKMVLCAVHDLLQMRSSRFTRQPWYEPPIGLSPEELVTGLEPHNDPRLNYPALSPQFQRYFRPAHRSPSPSGQPHLFYGNRSVSVGTYLPKSTSTE